MKKKLKQLVSLVTVFAFLSFNLLTPYMMVADAKTLGDLKKELADLEAKAKSNQEEAAMTQAEIARTRANIDSIQTTIKQIGIEVTEINAEIARLNLEIASSEKEIKAIVNFLQLAQGESAYLEYAFGAQDFTDFIYRVAVTEQLTDYNDKLIIEFNQMIEDGKQKQIELAAKEVELNKQQKGLEVELSKLGSRLNEIYDITVDVKDQIKTQKEIIKTYEDRGCKESDNIATCGRGVLPNNTRFWRPVNAGIVTSVYGDRCFMLNGSWYCDFHTGTDIGGMATGSPIYATASGTVAAITWQASCGGNQVLIHHQVNGRYYTSQYLHMLNIYVRAGDIVTRDTIIGTVGGDSSTWWDRCSTGTHLHFGLNNGLVGVDYIVWSSAFYANLINPQSMVNLPSGVWYQNRLNQY